LTERSFRSGAWCRPARCIPVFGRSGCSRHR
jgi:hypothetical protein